MYPVGADGEIDDEHEEIKDPTDKKGRSKGQEQRQAGRREKIQERESVRPHPMYASDSHKYSRSIFFSLGERA